MSRDSFFLGVGGFVFKVYSRDDSVMQYFWAYILPDTPDQAFDAEITITDRDIVDELVRSGRAVAQTEGQDLHHPYYETLVIFRKVAEYLPLRDAAVFHGVLLELNGEGYLFTAQSGTGKTTHALNWLKVFPDARIINGDKPILRIEGDRLMGYGTPWCGKERYQQNEKVPVKAVIWLKRGAENEIEEISAPEMIPKWISQTYRPQNEAAAARLFDTVLQMMSRVQLYRLHCNMDPESARIAYTGMNQESLK